MSEDRARHDVLARITDNPHLARAVPLLRPEVLHAVIAHCGLQDCGDLLALATSQQLSAVFDLDLWNTSRAGADEHFDAGRFGEWLEMLVETSPTIAAARLANMDTTLIVAGLSPSISVFDPAVFSPEGEPSGADPTSNAAHARGVHAEIGGYLVVARRPDAWDAIVDVLLALEEHEAGVFHRVMGGCRSLSHSGREIDGLDDLLPDAEQLRFDLSVSREERREQQGFLPPQQARAFLQSARHVPLDADRPHDEHISRAYQRSLVALSDPDIRSATESDEPQDDGPPADTASAVNAVIEVLRTAGVLADTPRALVPAARDEPLTAHAALNRYLQLCADSDAARISRDQELAFLANALVGGCSVQGRPFTRREAMDAVVATCNLGLVHWPERWLASSTHDLITAFQVGWTVLHGDVSMFAAERLIRVLDEVRCSDHDLQLGLYVLRRELHKQLQAGTPWRARGRLDVLATLDLPAWAALQALFDQCPVMLANVSRSHDRRRYTVNPSEFQFIADARHIAAVHEFLLSLTELLTS